MTFNEPKTLQRQTNETAITLKLNLLGSGKCVGSTAIGFFDHMLTVLCHYAGFDLEFNLEGDFHIDQHHSLEDFGYVLGHAFREALSDTQTLRRKRYAHTYVPMDESLVRAVIDLSGRPFLSYKVPKIKDLIGTLESDCLKEFIRAFVQNAMITCHIDVLEGENSHHIVEAMFKALALSLRNALEPTPNGVGPNSTKGTLY